MQNLSRRPLARNPSTALKTDSIGSTAPVEPEPFTPDLSARLRALYAQ